MRIFMIKGYSGSGKTSTVEALTGELVRRGYSVGTVKDIHFEGFEPDVPGTDTWRHRKAGARRVTGRGREAVSVIYDGPAAPERILELYDEDFVIFEGDCGVKCPTVITGRDRGDIDRRMCDEAVAVSGIVSEEPGFVEYRGLPVINGLKEVEKMADMVEKKAVEPEELHEVELTVNGKEIWMVPFVQRTLRNVVTGAVSALDGYEEGGEIVVRIR